MLKDLRNLLLDRLAAVLAADGFLRREQGFWRDDGVVGHVFHVGFINHSADFDITADVAVCHHEVEDALHAGRSDLNVNQRRETATVGAELGNLSGIGQQRWTVASLRDVEPAVKEIANWFERIGQPFLERYSSAEELLRTLEEDGAQARLICPIPQKRARVREHLQGQLRKGAV